MKYALLIILLFTTIQVEAQNIPAVWGIPFGISQDSTIRTTKQKRQLLPVADRPEPYLKYRNCEFGNFIAAEIMLTYFEDKFYRCDVRIDCADIPNLITDYTTLVKELTEKYGAPYKSATLLSKEEISKAKKSAVSTAITNATSSDMWYIPAGSDESNYALRIFTTSEKGENEINISYSYGPLFRQADDKYLQNVMNDY